MTNLQCLQNMTKLPFSSHQQNVFNENPNRIKSEYSLLWINLESRLTASRSHHIVRY